MQPSQANNQQPFSNGNLKLPSEIHSSPAQINNNQPNDDSNLKKPDHITVRRKYTKNHDFTPTENEISEDAPVGRFQLNQTLFSSALPDNQKTPKTFNFFTAAIASQNATSGEPLKHLTPEQEILKKEADSKSKFDSIQRPIATMSKKLSEMRLSKPKPKIDMTFMPTDELSQDKTIKEQKNFVVSINPLSSEDSLKERAKLSLSTKEKEKIARESPAVKSLFDFKGNSKYKDEQKENESAIFQPKTTGYVNPFMKNEKFVNPFASSATYVNPFASNSINFKNPFANDKSATFSALTVSPVPSQDATNEDCGDESPIKDDEIKAMAPTQIGVGGKQFQSQVRKIKILKGVGTQCPVACSKDTGYLSIELQQNVLMVVFRSLAGSNLFNGIINKKSAKIKKVEKAQQWRLKFTLAVAASTTTKFDLEHVEACFLCEKDYKDFLECYESVIKI